MVAPGAAGASFDVLLQFSLDEEAQKRVESRTTTIADELKRIQVEAKNAGKSINEGFKAGTEAVKQTDDALKKTGKTAEQTTSQVRLQIRNLRSEARAIISDVRLLRDQADDLDRLFKPLAVGGALIVGGFFAAANKYVKDAEQATETTEKWTAAQEDLAKSGNRIGEVLAKEALPILQDVAKITRDIASILEAHPEVARAVLSAGLVALAVGTVGKAVTSGIRLYADLKLDRSMLLQQTAAQLQLKASENQLKAAGIQAETSSIKNPVGTGGGLGQVILTATAVIIGAELGTILGNKIGELITGGKTGLAGPGGFGVGDVAVAGLAATQTPSFLLIQGLNKLGIVSENTVEKMRTNLTEFDRFAAGLLGANKILNVINNLSPQKIQDNLLAKPQSFLGGSQENQDRAVEAFSDWRQADAQIVQDAMNARKEIIAEGERDIVNLTRDLTNERTRINTQFNNQDQQIRDRFEAANAQADERLIQDRANIIQEGEERLREIHEEEQQKSEEAERNFAKAALQAGRDRDALALQDAQDARDEALEEASRGTEESIQRERRETQERLNELNSRYIQERDQRKAQYEADLKDSAVRRAAALKEAQDRYNEELKQAREANAQKLRDAAEAANQERINRRNQLIDQLNDLGITLNSERQIRLNGYGVILNDLQRWIQQMGGLFSAPTVTTLGTASGGTASSLSTATNLGFSGSGMYGTHDYSGYAYKGVYRMAQNGKPEWVMSGADTQAAESAIGGTLTQSNMAQMIALMAAARGSQQVVDNSVYGKDMTVQQIRDIKEETSARLRRMLGDY